MLLIQQQEQDHSGTIHDSTPEQPQQNHEEIAGTQHNNRSKKKVVGKYWNTGTRSDPILHQNRTESSQS